MVRFLVWSFSDRLLSGWTGRLFSMKIICRIAKCVTVTHASCWSEGAVAYPNRQKR
jgi:hypothetical protein